MLLYELIEIIDEIIIVKKAKDKMKENPNYTIPKQKETFSARELPKIENYKIVINGHTKEIRDNENHPRDFNFTDDDYRRVLKLFIKRIKKENLSHGNYSLFYKNKSGKYDMIGVNFTLNRITVITIIQQSKNINKYKNDIEYKKLILENYISLFLD